MRKFPKVLRGGTVALALSIGTLAALGQSLGEPRTVARVGQPLQLTVPARYSARDSGQECTSAQVSYGDRVLPSSQVWLTVVGRDELRQVQLEALQPVDEPVVSVVLRVGCRDVVTRRYALLPDSPFAQEPVAAVATVPVPGRASIAPQPAVSSPPPAAAAVTRNAKPASAERPRAEPRPQRKPAPPATTKPAAPVLRVEPLDLPDAAAAMRLSTEMAEPSAEAGARARAARLWEAFRADPEERARQAVRLQQVERDLVQLRLDAGRVQADLAALKQLAESDEHRWGWGQLLALVLLLSVALAAVLALRQRDARGGARPVVWDDALVQPVAAVSAAAPMSPQDVPVLSDVVEMRVADAPLQPEVPRAVPATTAETSLRVETLLHTLQEVDFLRMLGQTGRAIESLQHYVSGSASPSPLAFLAWMELCVAVRDRHALDSTRLLYVDTFGCEPPGRLLLDPGCGLEQHPGMLAQLTAAWGTPQLPQVVEAFLFSAPRGDDGLSLQAGREMLFLHELDAAKRTTELQRPAADAELAPASGFWSTLPPSYDIPESSWIGFDVDLDALERAHPAPPAPPAAKVRSRPAGLTSGYYPPAPL